MSSPTTSLRTALVLGAPGPDTSLPADCDAAGNTVESRSPPTEEAVAVPGDTNLDAPAEQITRAHHAVLLANHGPVVTAPALQRQTAALAPIPS
ncbi:hypothetical protein SGFS_011310 [Streptomyces graminofaciens]|uniref:Class II aldolase/adducin N-terminal domain-containing protein n=1 Tax=Streptomyces graminofaciens TaxID=68212 RepID=A0ABN5VAR5_9ACTN|nr:hypothetical protein [Streptomyces graminofaciens]BBC29837.1 hypothetical protein SGFS_011310 [Streptomyces graminofaciens]